MGVGAGWDGFSSSSSSLAMMTWLLNDVVPLVFLFHTPPAPLRPEPRPVDPVLEALEFFATLFLKLSARAMWGFSLT